MNTFMSNLKETTNYTLTENGALTHKTTGSKVYDLFAQGAAYRTKNEYDCQRLFKNAYDENPDLAMKCLFYIRDVRGGQGERRFFRTCFKWLAQAHSESASKNLDKVSEFGRWDDLIYATEGTKLEGEAFGVIKEQLALDIQCKTPSLLAKWMPSENASSSETKRVAGKLRAYLGMNHRQYRKTLSILRERINVLERLMSANKWDEIEFDKIPSKAGLIYKNAFARRDIIAKKYEAFITNENTTVNADTLYPYDIVAKAIRRYGAPELSNVERAAVNKYWANQKDYLDGADCKMMCVIDTSGSMTGSTADAPLNVAIGLGMYCAERIGGPFKNHFITFSEHPQFVEIDGFDFVDSARRIYKRNECANTDLVRTFDLLLSIARKSKKEDIPDTLVVVSDMQIDCATCYGWGRDVKSIVKTDMERMREKWASYGLTLPHLVYWNVRASEGNILDDGPNVSYVSGASPSIFKQVLTGKTGWDLMIETICADRYKEIIA